MATEDKIKEAQQRKEKTIKEAQDRKNYQIKTFQSAKTEEMIKFAAARIAESITSWEIALTQEETAKDWWERFEKNLAEAEKRLKKYITGTPF